MGVYQGTMFFGYGNRGWSETWYTNQGGAPDSILGSLRVVAAVRAQVVAQPAALRAVRVSDVTIRGDSTMYFYAGGLKVAQQAALDGADVPGAAWYCRADGDDMNRRQFWVRGMPDDWFQIQATNPDPSMPNPPPALVKWLPVYYNVLVNEGWGIYGFPAGGAPRRNPAVDVTIDPATKRVVVTLGQAVGITPNVNERCKLLGGRYQNKPPLNLTVAAIQGNSYIMYQTMLSPPGYLGGSLLQAYPLKQAIGLRNLTPIRPGRRRPGRAFFVPRGRFRRG